MQSIHGEIAAMVTFFTKLPAWLTAYPQEQLKEVDPARACRFAPVAGALVGAIGSLAIAIAGWVGVPPVAAMILGLAAMLAVTGALHEDGLADVADALGATTAERRLEIMRDSRIGTFGAVALWCALSLRLGLMLHVLSAGLAALAATLIASHAISRICALYLAYALPSARREGASASFGRPDAATFLQGVAVAGLFAVMFLPAAAGISGMFVAILAAMGTAVAMARFSRRGFGGQTGDLMGATQQVSELALLVCVAIFAI